MNTIKYIVLLLALHFVIFVLEGNETRSIEKMTCTTFPQDSTYLDLADILEDAGDVSTSATILNQFIERKERGECFDKNYVQALYRAQSLYALIDFNKAMQINRKIEVHDKDLPQVKIENGFLTAEKFGFELDEKMQLFMKQMVMQSGMCGSEDEIEFSEGSIKIKLKPGCCCRKDDPI